MSSMKRCVQCGILKETDAFRPYTYSRQKETNGRYRICRTCEAINVAYNRAKDTVADPSEQQTSSGQLSKCAELVEKTEQLYNMLASRGLRVPTREKTEENNLDRLLAFYDVAVLTGGSKAVPTEVIEPDAVEQAFSITVPDELNQWLLVDKQVWIDSNISPEYLQETVYESLKAKYRPQIGVDHNTYLPIYDDTYKPILNSILRRFDDYEEDCSIAE